MRKIGMKKTLFATTLGAAVLAVPISPHWSPAKTLSLSLDTANARIGHPASPGSVAGVNRRVNRRAARRGYYGAGYGAGVAGAAVAGAAVAGAAAAGPYYGGGGGPAPVGEGYALIQFDNGRCEVWSNGYPSGSGWTTLAGGLPNWNAGEAAYHLARSQGVCSA